MSDTPRTEAEYYTVECAANYGMGDEYADHVVPVDFARTLERELNAALIRIAELEAQHATTNDKSQVAGSSAHDADQHG